MRAAFTPYPVMHLTIDNARNMSGTYRGCINDEGRERQGNGSGSNRELESR